MERNDYAQASDQSQKLTSWTQEPTILVLKTDLQSAQPSQQTQLAKIGHWNDLLKTTGKARPARVKGRSSVQPKLVRRQAEWRYSALSEPFLGATKLFSVKPVTFEDDAAAKQNELLLNWQFRTKLNRVKFIDDLTRATVDEGTSIVRTGWDRHTVKAKKEMPIWTHYEFVEGQDDERFAQFQEAVELAEQDPRTFGDMDPALKAAVDLYNESGQATYAEQTGTEMVEYDKILSNKPVVEVMNPANVFIDPSCLGDLDKALFVVVSFETNQAELKKQGKRYKNLEQVNWENNAPISTPDHETTTPQDFRFGDVMRKKVVAYEYWGYYDIHKNGVLEPIVCTWIGEILIRMELNPFADRKLPFVVIPYMPIKRDLYGEPDAELLEDNQAILGAVARGMIDLMGRSANAQQGFAKGMLDPLNRRKYEEGKDYEYNPNQNPHQGIIEHKYPEIPRSAMEMLNLQNQEAEALTGVKSFSGGMSGSAYGDVAAGIKGLLDAAAKREMAILRRLAKGVTEIGRKIIAMNGQFLSEEEVVRVTNEQFVKVKREELQGEFDLEVDISTAEVDNAKSQDLAFMLQTIGPNGDIGMVMLILSEIADLKRMPALAEKLRNYKPAPDPIAEEMKQLELEKLKMEVNKLRTAAKLDEAKAAETQAQTDLANLDFVEKETGTEHERNMELTRGQARGNQNLQVTKALTAPRKEGETAPDIEAAVGFNELSEQLGRQPDPGQAIPAPQVVSQVGPLPEEQPVF